MDDKILIRDLEQRVEELERQIMALKEACAIDTNSLPESVIAHIQNGQHPLRALRQWRLLTQIELARASGVGVNYISRIENCTSFGLRTAQKLAEALDVSVSDLTRPNR